MWLPRAYLKVPLMPAWLAGLPVGASSTRMPSSPSCLTVCGGAMVMPSTGRMTLPNLSICSTRPLTESTGMANPTPEDAPRPAQFGSSMVIHLFRERLRSSDPFRRSLSQSSHWQAEHCVLCARWAAGLGEEGGRGPRGVGRKHQ